MDTLRKSLAIEIRQMIGQALAAHNSLKRLVNPPTTAMGNSGWWKVRRAFPLRSYPGNASKIGLLGGSDAIVSNLQITAEDGTLGRAKLPVFEFKTERPEDLVCRGSPEGKALMAAVAGRRRRVASWAERHRCCEACGAPPAQQHPVGSSSPFYGDVRVASPRLHRCPCQGADGPAAVLGDCAT